MLVVAPVVTAMRALLVITGIAEPGWYWIGFALGGSLSALGLALVLTASWGGTVFRIVLAGAALAFVGHYVLPITPAAMLGPAMVQLGTGVSLAPWARWSIGAGVVAGIGSVMRHALPVLGNAVLLLGAIALLWAVIQAARHPAPSVGTVPDMPGPT